MLYFNKQIMIREAFKTQIRLKLGYCPNRMGGWLTVTANITVPTVYEIFLNGHK